MLELWQAEWCPFSHRVRARLTELEIDWVARTVELSRDERDRMDEATGTRSIPTLVDGRTVVRGADEIVSYLDSTHGTPADADGHRAQMRAEWPHWVELHSQS